MKKILLLLLLFDLSLKSFATTYYVANSGSDSNNGTSKVSPWQTLSKVSNFAFSPGDSILFNKGDTWKGNTLYINQNGTITKPITWSSYGTGTNPLFSGFITTSGWVNVGNGIWTYTNSSLPTTINLLTINRKVQALGRYPKTGYNTYTFSNGTTSITDEKLSNSPTFVGGEVVIKKNHYNLTRGTIKSQFSGIITYSALGSNQQNATNGYGYFIQNHINCLSAIGDWCYDANNHKISMYFGSELPTSYLIEVSNVDALIKSVGVTTYNIFSNLSLEGSNSYGLYCNYGSSYNQINNCTVIDIGISALYLPGANNTIVNNNHISDCLNNAITIFGIGNKIIENVINRTGVTPGMGQSSDGVNGSGAYTTMFAGYPSGSSNTIIQYNQILNSGYMGINVSGDNLLINKNFIDTFCSVLDDGGGIYTYTGTSPIIYTNRTISNNVVLNGVGAPEGTNNINQGNGIYCDDNSSNLTITNNTVANCGQYGYFLHNNHEITFTENLSYNNKYAQLSIGHDDIVSSLPRNFKISKNTLIANSPTQLCLYFYSLANNSSPTDFTTFGISNNNYYNSLFQNTNVISTQLINSPSIIGNLDSWRTITLQDSLSTLSNPTYISTIFKYNIARADENIILDGIYFNITGSNYICALNLASFTSVFLLLPKTSITFDKAVIVTQ